jgi:carbamoyl-phosphate synthase large subunit
MSKLKDLIVLLSATNSPSMPGMYHFLKNNGERNITVIGIDMSSDPSAKYIVDKFYQVPAATADDYIDIVLDICKKEHVDIYFPTISAEVTKVAERRSEFDAINTLLSISNLNSVNIANNKLHTYQALEKAGIPVPKYYGVHSIEDFIEGCKYLGYPQKAVCLKIVNGSGSRGVRIIDANKSRYEIFAYEKPNSFYTSYDDMISILKDANVLDELMLLECMHGPEYTVDLLAQDGEVLYMAGRENVVSLMSIAQESVIKDDSLAFKISKDVVKLLRMDGNVGFDFMRNDKGEAVLMDINPRTTATISLLAAGGLNLMYLRIKQLLGEELPDAHAIIGTRIKRRYGEIYTSPTGDRIGI